MAQNPQTIQVRRDNSVNNVPFVAYNDGVDAQDVIMCGVYQQTEALIASASGTITLSYRPVNNSGELYFDGDNIKRGRIYNTQDIQCSATGGSTTYYAGNVDAYNRVVSVYTDSALSASVTAGTAVTVTYLRRVPLRVDQNGNLQLTITGTQNVIVTEMPDVTIANQPIDVNVTNTPDVNIANQPIETTTA